MRNLPFLEEILADLRRFAECVEDNNDVNLERSRFDLLVQLGLLERVQRSPARWMMTQAGEDAIAPPAAAHGDEAVEVIATLSVDDYFPNSGVSHPHLAFVWEISPQRQRELVKTIKEPIRLVALTAPPAAAHGDEAVRKDAAAAYVAMSCNSVLIDGSTCYYLPAERMAAFDRMFSLGDAMRAQAGEGGE